MIFTIAAFIVVFGVIFGTLYQDEGIFSSVFGATICGAIAGILMFLLTCVPAIVWAGTHDEGTNSVNYTIVAVDDELTTQGHFSIFGGNIDSTYYYYYYGLDEHGGYSIYRVDSREASIQEDATPTTANLEKITMNGVGNCWWSCYRDSYEFYVFHVPPGTIVKQYNLNLGGK